MLERLESVKLGPFRNFKGLLLEWTWLNKHIAQAWNWEDCPWWCNERASLSTLAGAVWNIRGIALEEYASCKLKSKKESRGRCDLYFRLKRNGYVAEAKLCWLRPGAPVESMSEQIRKCLSNACVDASKNSPSLYRDETLLGIAFVVPRIPQQKIEDGNVGEQIRDVQKAILHVYDSKECALAWIFPRNARNMKSEDDNCIYPGTAILIKRA